MPISPPLPPIAPPNTLYLRRDEPPITVHISENAPDIVVQIGNETVLSVTMQEFRELCQAAQHYIDTRRAVRKEQERLSESRFRNIET